MLKSVKVKLQSVNELQTFTSKDYNFLTDLELKPGDVVVADTKMGLSLGKVTSISTIDVNPNATAWVVCIVDTEQLEERKIKAEELFRVQRDMLERKKVIEQRHTFQSLAKEDAEMAELLAKYDELVK